MVNTNKENLESCMNYFFNNKELMIRALTHSSLVKKDDSYEILEFLGDSILNFIVSKYGIDKSFLIMSNSKILSDFFH